MCGLNFSFRAGVWCLSELGGAVTFGEEEGQPKSLHCGASKWTHCRRG
jgi:hypothetical protein